MVGHRADGLRQRRLSVLQHVGTAGPRQCRSGAAGAALDLISYSTGVKFRFLDNRLEVNNEIYFYDYKDLLIAPFDDNPAHYGNTFYNADKTEIYGDEIDIKFLLTPTISCRSTSTTTMRAPSTSSWAIRR